MLKALLATFVLLSSSLLAAGIPDTINYQGRLRLNSAGNPPAPDSSGNTVEFRIFASPTGGTVLWSEAWNGSPRSHVTTTAGLFNVVLGTWVPLSLPFDQPYWLEIVWTNSGGSPEVMSPRQPLTTAPYAFRAKFADSPSIPLILEGSAGFPGSVLSATNTGSGYGVYGAATGPGVSAGMPDDSHQITAGVYGFSGATLSAGVLGMNNQSLTKDAAGVIALGHFTGIYGFGYGATGTASGGTFESPFGTGVTARGVTAVAAEINGSGLTALWARSLNPQGTALWADGRSHFAGKVTLAAGAISQDSLEMNANKIVDMADPTSPQDAATKNYVDTQVGGGNFVLRTGDAMSGDLDMTMHYVKNVQDPAAAYDAANKGYVDMNFLGLGGGNLGGPIDMGMNRINGLQDPMAGTDAVNLNYLNTELGNYVSKAGDGMFGQLDMGNSRISSLAGPIAGQDAANKNYIDLNFLSLSGGNLGGPLDLGLNRITGLQSPLSSNDAVNLTYLQSELGNYVSKGGDGMFGQLDMGSNRITSLGNPIGGQDAVNLSYLQSNYIGTGGGSFSGSIDMGFNRILSLGSPLSGDDAATKGYVDSNFVYRAGDTMTGTLNLPGGGLTVGSDQLYVTPSGSIGMGTASPSLKLDLRFTGTNGIRVDSTDSGQSSLGLYRGGVPAMAIYADGTGGHLESMSGPLLFHSGASEKARLDSAGNLGIGTTTVANKLDVRFSGNDGIRVDSISGNAPEVSLYQAGAKQASFFSNSTVSYLQTTGADNLELGTNALSRLFIAPAGDVGVGAFPNTSGKLQVFAGTAIGLSATTSSGTSTVPAIYGINVATASTAYGVRGSTHSSAGAGVYGANLSAAGGIAVLGVSANGIGLGVMGSTEAGAPAFTVPVGAYGYSNKATGVGVFGKSANAGGGAAIVAEGTLFGLSATASSGTAVYGRVSGAADAFSAQNDGTGSAGLFLGVGNGLGSPTIDAWNTGTGSQVTAIRAMVSGGSALTGGYALYSDLNTGFANSVTLVAGIHNSGLNTGSALWGKSFGTGGMGVTAENASSAANLSNGGAALMVKGRIRASAYDGTVPLTNDGLTTTQSVTLTAGSLRQTGRIQFTAGKSGIGEYAVMGLGGLVDASSIVLISYFGTPPNFDAEGGVTVGPGFFVVNLPPATNFPTNSGFNFLVINLQ